MLNVGYAMAAIGTVLIVVALMASIPALLFIGVGLGCLGVLIGAIASFRR